MSPESPPELVPCTCWLTMVRPPSAMSVQLGPRLPLARAKLSDADVGTHVGGGDGDDSQRRYQAADDQRPLENSVGRSGFFVSVFKPYSFSREEISRQPQARETSGALGLRVRCGQYLCPGKRLMIRYLISP